jgi:hypothetical protein
MSLRSPPLLTASLCLLLACAGDAPAVQPGPSGDGDDPTDDGDGDGDDPSGDGDGGEGAGPGPVKPGNGSEETCDGLDNDDNGIVDDRDVEQDGVCDCLAIAYLGSPTGAAAGDVFADWLDQRSDVGARKLASISESELAKYDVLVVQNMGLLGASFTAAQLDAIEEWVKAGGGLLTLTGYGNIFSEPNDVNPILARFGLSYRPPLVLLSPSGTAGTLPITQWVHPHPVTEGISTIGFNNGYPVDGDGVALASEMGHVVLRAKEVGKGHVLAWGDEWITFNSEWKAHTDYQVERLWQNMIKWLTAADVCQVPIELL